MLSVGYSVYCKKGQNSDAIKEVTSKGREVYPSDSQTLSNAINISYVLVLICRIPRELNLSSVIVLRKGVCSLFITLKPRSAVYVDTGQVNKVYKSCDICSGIELELAWSKVLTKVCSPFQFSKRIKEI